MTKKTKTTPEKKNPEILTRAVDLTRESIVDDESRLVRLSFSSEEPVTRQSFFSDPWVEVLGHGAGEADLERLNSSAPVLYNHDRNERGNRIGVVERAWIENNRGHAEIRLSKRDEVEGFWQDVRDGILRNVSVSYRINERKLQEEHKDKPDLYRVVSWTPMEISLVDIPAGADLWMEYDIWGNKRYERQILLVTTPDVATILAETEYFYTTRNLLEWVEDPAGDRQYHLH